MLVFLLRSRSHVCMEVVYAECTVVPVDDARVVAVAAAVAVAAVAQDMCMPMLSQLELSCIRMHAVLLGF